MTIARSNTGGWGTNDKLGSAQINALDINTTYALDKRTGQTDTLLSNVTVSGTGTITSGVGGGIVSTAADGIAGSVYGAIASVANGAIQHAGGPSDWVSFATARSVVRRASSLGCIGIDPTHLTLQPSSMWIIGDGTAAQMFYEVNRLMHNGATLVSVTAMINVSGGYTSLPAAYPRINVKRRNATTGAVADVLRAAGDAIFPTPANTAAWIASGGVQTWTYTCDQNNVIDRTVYDYLVTVTDANGGTGSIINAFTGLTLTFSTNDMRFA